MALQEQNVLGQLPYQLPVLLGYHLVYESPYQVDAATSENSSLLGLFWRYKSTVVCGSLLNVHTFRL